MRIKTCFVGSGLTSPGILLHTCWHADPLCSAKASTPRLGIPRLALPTHSHPRYWLRRALGWICPSRSKRLFPTLSACVCVWVCLERERGGGRMRERVRERGRERGMDLHAFPDPFSSFISMPLIPCPWIWVPPATRTCGLARGGSPSAALAPATAGTRRASEAWQPRGNAPESLLEETNQESLTHQTWFPSGLHSLAPCCQERLFSKRHKDISLSLLNVCVCVCVCVCV